LSYASEMRPPTGDYVETAHPRGWPTWLRQFCLGRLMPTIRTGSGSPCCALAPGWTLPPKRKGRACANRSTRIPPACHFARPL